MSPAPVNHIQTRRGDNVRIGPVSIITLIVVICMAVLAVLAASTAHATATITDRQAESTQMLYQNELAAQEFVASVDDVLARARSAEATNVAALVENGLDKACANAREAADGRVECTANMNGNTVTAEFVCDGKRQLNIAITIRDDATYRIAKWKMASVQQEAPTAGSLWTGV